MFTIHLDTLRTTFFDYINNTGVYREVFIDDIEIDCCPMFEIFDICEGPKLKSTSL